MPESILKTKLIIPLLRPDIVLRPHLFSSLNEGLKCKLTLVSAPAGFGKTTLVGSWAAGCGMPAAWLSLDEGDSDPAVFFSYLTASLQTIVPDICKSVTGLLQSPQPPVESILTVLLNDISNIPAVPENFILVLDDYHVIDSRILDKALAYLLEHQPPRMHIIIATREDPDLPLARLRARGELTEIRTADLRFTPVQAAGFFRGVMGLNLSAEEVAALEARTEGWIAGLQLAAISMQGQKDVSGFIKSFTGSHHFIMDYLLEEVLQQQSPEVQAFLLRTSILDRLCGPLCDAVTLESSGQETLEYLEHANMFIVPLDHERHWYRYHRLFADLLRQRLSSRQDLSADQAAGYHKRASSWYEENGFEIEAFHHAAAANDIDLAVRLIEGKVMPLHFRGTMAVITILKWLESLPGTVLEKRPPLLVKYASLMLVTGRTTGVEEKLQAAETAMEGAEQDGNTRNLIGQIAAARATLALSRYDVETMMSQSRRALENLDPGNLPLRNIAIWTLGVAYHYQGDRARASRAYSEAMSISQATGDILNTLLSAIGMGNIQEAENQLYQAADTYRRVLKLEGDTPQPVSYEAHLGLARISYEWNDLEAAEKFGQQSLILARQYDRVIDRFVICEVFLARLKLALGDAAGAADILHRSGQFARDNNFVHRIPEVAAAQVLTFIRQGNLEAAASLLEKHENPVSRARLLLARGNPSAAFALLEDLREQAESRGWKDELLRVKILQAIALHENGDKNGAVQAIGAALAEAQSGGFIRIFVDEGIPMANLLSSAAGKGVMSKGVSPEYLGRLMAAFKPEKSQPLIEELSRRELEVLRLIAAGFSNQEICERLFLALSSVKGHNKNIFAKLQVRSRTEAAARARELGLL